MQPEVTSVTQSIAKISIFLLTLIFPVLFAVPTILMFPLVLGNSTLNLCFIAVLLGSPAASIAVLARATGRTYFFSQLGIILFQAFLDAVINDWFRALS